MPAVSRPSAEPNVTPMIDVLLVLLIVFMVVVVQVYHTMDVRLPIPCTGTCNGDAPIILEVLPGPAYRINHTDVAPGALADQLRALYAPRPEKIIQVAGHPGVRYQDVMAAMDIARSAGVRVIGIPPKDAYLNR